MSDVPPPDSHIHLIAVCGVGMASLAGLLHRAATGDGSDQNVYPAHDPYWGIGIPVLPGFRRAYPAATDLSLSYAFRAQSRGAGLSRPNIRIFLFPSLGSFSPRLEVVSRFRRHARQDPTTQGWCSRGPGSHPCFFRRGVPLNSLAALEVGAASRVIEATDTRRLREGPQFLHYRPSSHLTAAKSPANLPESIMQERFLRLM